MLKYRHDVVIFHVYFAWWTVSLENFADINVHFWSFRESTLRELIFARINVWILPCTDIKKWTIDQDKTSLAKLIPTFSAKFWKKIHEKLIWRTAYVASQTRIFSNSSGHMPMTKHMFFSIIFAGGHFTNKKGVKPWV